jgi:hypothetical protein
MDSGSPGFWGFLPFLCSRTSPSFFASRTTVLELWLIRMTSSAGFPSSPLIFLVFFLAQPRVLASPLAVKVSPLWGGDEVPELLGLADLRR